ncbi:interleukin-1 beta-like [Ambystoma mexicanum]|uniref:interleukin-1 beta-like n=1 Tax=Ambystoma mexicanum TaxID=8296 RepID=UPI0037E7449F
MSLVPEMGMELMESYSESYENFYDDDSVCKMEPSMPNASWGSCSGRDRECQASIQVKLTVAKGTPTFRQAVVVVVALEKMKRGILHSCLFSDSDLLELLGTVLVEENVPCRSFEATSMAESVYRQFSTSVKRVTDTANKCMVLNEFSGQAQLVALHLQGQNIDLQVKLDMALYRTSPSPGAGKLPVTLGIVGRNLYLSCVMVDGKPELRLEEVNRPLDPIKTDLLRFLFFKVDTASSGNPSSTFESASCPRWYISTSQNENEPVTVTSSNDQNTIQNFKLFSE